MNVLYFAYGSCMSPEDLARDVSDFELVGPALVRGFRLGFTRYSRARRGGVADLVPDMAGVVEGVLYRVPVEQLAALDEREGAPDNYRRDFIAVRTPDGRIYDGVLTYVVADKSAKRIPPHPDYVATIITRRNGHAQSALRGENSRSHAAASGAENDEGRSHERRAGEKGEARSGAGARSRIGRERKQNRSGTDDASRADRRTDEDRAAPQGRRRPTPAPVTSNYLPASAPRPRASAAPWTPAAHESDARGRDRGRDLVAIIVPGYQFPVHRAGDEADFH